MEPSATPVISHLQAETWEAYPLISPTKFAIMSVFTFGLYGLWWQYKTWRFFKQWQRSDTWPVVRALFSIFTFYELVKTINQFAYHSGGYTPIPNPTGLAAGYIVLSLFGRLPDPFWLVALGAWGFLVPAFREFRYAMLQSPAYGGYEQPHFKARHWITLSAGLVIWGLAIVGMTMPE